MKEQLTDETKKEREIEGARERGRELEGGTMIKSRKSVCCPLVVSGSAVAPGPFSKACSLLHLRGFTGISNSACPN